MPGCLMIHVMTSGSGVLEVGDTTQTLRTGDFALVPHGDGHTLRSATGAHVYNLLELPREELSERYENICFGGGGETATMVCAVVRFDHPTAHRLIHLLPRLLYIDSWDSPDSEWLQSTLRFMAAEARDLRPGGETVITRLADVLVVQAIRTWMSQDPNAQRGWLGALRDPQLGKAIATMHSNPERSWSVAMLAHLSAMSRSTFSARFTEQVGETPMRYLTRCRMYTALGWLRDSSTSVGEISHRLGYQSEAAFNRAFKRVVGFTPGVARHRGVTLAAV